MSAPTYRSEIDGLRGVSVLVILLFHLKVTAFSGGFIGVDVFFVISGFLITNIILRDLEREKFSFREFYARRLARIVPALAVVIGLSLVLATVLYTPRALEHAMQQGLAALFSLSNIFFWAEANYWSPDAKGFLLLHTWSLGVEEQFYLFYPLLLFGCYRLGGLRGVWLFMLVMVVAGAAVAERYLGVDRTAVFYLTPFRLYEFALGGLGSLAMARLANLRGVWRLLPLLGAVAGLGLILHSALNFSFFTLFPGVNALQPTVGALLVILSGPSVVTKVLLSNPLIVWAGRLSYSLYLVHWPVIVLYRYVFGPNLQYSDQVLLGFVSLVLAYALNRTVELQFRLTGEGTYTRSGMVAGQALWMTGGAMFLVGGLALAGMIGDGWPSRMPDGVHGLIGKDLSVSPAQKAITTRHCEQQAGVFCGERRSGADNIMLLADSRVYDIYIALRAAYPEYNIYTSYAIGCAPLMDRNLSHSRFVRNCPQINKARMQAALDAPNGEIVFLAMDLNGWRATATLETARQLVRSGKRVYVLGQTQFLDGKTPLLISIDQKRWSYGKDYVSRFVVPKPFALDDEYGKFIEDAGATYISNRGFFFRDHYRIYTEDGKNLLSYDGKHLSEAGAVEFGQYLMEQYPF